MLDRAPRILLVDDEQSIQTLLSYPLRRDGYEVVQAVDGREALDRFDERPFDLVVLDVMLPKLDGLEVCRRLRSRSAVPIIMLTAKSEEIDKVVGLEIGADDYITKPFDLRELLARVKAVLRRTHGDADAVSTGPAARLKHRFAGWELDVAARRLLDPERREVALTSGEFDLLSTFVDHAGRVLSRDFLLEQTRGREAGPFDRTIDVQIGRLRRKIERDADDPQLIKSVRGAGYILVAPVTSG